MTTSDPPDVGRHEDLYLRRFVAARAAGDRATSRHWWGELLTVRMDWLRLAVRLEAGDRLDAQEQQEAVQNAAIKITVNLHESFKGTSMGEWVNAVKRLVHGICIDVQRREARAHKHTTPMESAYEDQEGRRPSPYETALAKHATERRTEKDAAEADAEWLARRQAFLDWALPQISEKRRAIVELDAAGASTEEMQAALGGATRDVVYATRLRAYKQLNDLMRTYES